MSQGQDFGINFCFVLQGEAAAKSIEFNHSIGKALAKRGFIQSAVKNNPHLSLLHRPIKAEDLEKAFELFTEIVVKVIGHQEFFIELSKLYVTSNGTVGKDGHTWFDYRAREIVDGVIEEHLGRKMQEIQVRFAEELDKHGIFIDGPDGIIPRCSEISYLNTLEQQEKLEKNKVAGVGNLNEHATLSYNHPRIPDDVAEEVKKEALPESHKIIFSAKEIQVAAAELTFSGEIPVILKSVNLYDLLMQSSHPAESHDDVHPNRLL
jgi:hypothetical protein